MPTDKVSIHRFIIGELSAAGIDSNQLIRDIGLPSWALTNDDGHVPSKILGRLWEIAEYELGEPDIAITLAQRFRLTTLGLYDYLFSSSPTLGAALATSERYITAATTNLHCEVVTGENGDVTLCLDLIEGDGRGRDHNQLWALTGALTRGRQVLDIPLDPTLVTFRQAAPRRIDAYTDVFGGAAIEFDAPMDSITFRAADAHHPLTTSDPALATVLRPLAESLPPPPQPATTWIDQVASALADALDTGELSLELVARRLMTSPRTLQRRLRDAGTTWRIELDRARATRLAEHATHRLTRDRQAQLLGYADPTSIRRAARRWSNTDADRPPDLRAPTSPSGRYSKTDTLHAAQATSGTEGSWPAMRRSPAQEPPGSDDAEVEQTARQ
ncbi:AraC family transcriptional regulator [Nocardia cyriacigeorgica]|uniref:AraC family transcriptional regulator n=1 Tax=Nocardia cyriacigeorgica TaxID=135487 RepID=UPI002457E693|nr:AraC family transcriptional regulator [Nocardia cyriacigeorgica]